MAPLLKSFSLSVLEKNENRQRSHTLLGRVAVGAQRPLVVKLTRGRSVIGLSAYPVHCGKTADRIRQPFGII